MYNEKEHVLTLLEIGKIVRLVDGRCGGEFVSLKALNELIDEGLAEIFIHCGFHFVRIAKEK